MVHAEDVCFHTGCNKCDKWVHMLRNPWSGMEGNGSPYTFNITFVDTVSLKEATCCIRTIYLETATFAAMFVRQT